ncbi:MAG: hypothetical protein V3R85_03520, partial [Alphaproteobacteria bacterium]
VPPVMTHTSEELKELSSDDRISVVNLDTFRFSGDDKNGDTALKKARDSKRDRDGLQSILMGRSVTKCTNFQKFLYAVHGTRKLALRSVALALSGAGAIFTGGTSQALSAASTGIQGFDEAYDAEILQQQSITLILQTINISRTALANEIKENRKGDKKAYPAEEAIYDVERYHSLCSLTKAISKLAKAVQENEDNKKKIKDISDERDVLKLQNAIMARQAVPSDASNDVKANAQKLIDQAENKLTNK